MYLPMTRERWLEYERMYDGPIRHLRRIEDEAEVVRRNVDWLLAHLYDPHPEVGARASDRIRGLGLDDEPINWGDLKAIEAKLDGGTWRVVIDEAAPDCPNLSAYVAGWLWQWGWGATVETVW